MIIETLQLIPKEKGKRTLFRYDGSNNNVELSGYIYKEKKPKQIYLDLFSAQHDDEKPRANKGVARLILCKFMNHLMKKNIIDDDWVFQLEPGLYSDRQTQKHSIQKLRRMYKSMGFKRIPDSDQFKMKVPQFIEWCKSNYSDEFFELL